MSRHQSRRVRRAFVLIAAVGALGITLTGTTAGAQTVQTQGVDKNSVKLGFIWSGTGVASRTRRVRKAQRRNRPCDFAGDAQRLAARGENPNAGARL